MSAGNKVEFKQKVRTLQYLWCVGKVVHFLSWIIDISHYYFFYLSPTYWRDRLEEHSEQILVSLVGKTSTKWDCQNEVPYVIEHPSPPTLPSLEVLEPGPLPFVYLRTVSVPKPRKKAKGKAPKKKAKK